MNRPGMLPMRKRLQRPRPISPAAKEESHGKPELRQKDHRQRAARAAAVPARRARGSADALRRHGSRKRTGIPPAVHAHGTTINARRLRHRLGDAWRDAPDGAALAAHRGRHRLTLAPRRARQIHFLSCASGATHLSPLLQKFGGETFIRTDTFVRMDCLHPPASAPGGDDHQMC